VKTDKERFKQKKDIANDKSINFAMLESKYKAK